MLFLLQQILPAALLATALSAGISALAFVRRDVRLGNVVTPLALGLAYAAGHFFASGRLDFPPTDSTNWLAFIALSGGILGATWCFLGHGALRPLLVALCSVASLRLLLAPKFRHAWPAATGWSWVIGLSVAVVLFVVVMQRLNRRAIFNAETTLLLLIICGGTTAALMLSGSILLGQLAAILTGAVAGTGVYSWKEGAANEAVTAPAALLLIALLASGCFFAELPRVSALLLLASPALAVAVNRLNLNRAAAFAFRAVLIAIPTGIALYLAFRSSPPLEY